MLNFPKPIVDSIYSLAPMQLGQGDPFSSRARSTNQERSDIELATQRGDTVTFAASVDEDIPTFMESNERNFAVARLRRGADWLSQADRQAGI